MTQIILRMAGDFFLKISKAGFALNKVLYILFF